METVCIGTTPEGFKVFMDRNAWEADGVLKAYGVWLDYTVDDFNREGEATRNIRERPQE